MSNDYMLTTIDNPYNPFDDFTLWLLYDKELGYNTCEFLARIAKLSSDLSDKETEDEIERAMNEIIEHDPFNVYKKVTKDDFKVESNTDETAGEDTD